MPRFRALWLAGFVSWYGDFLTLPALLIIAYDLGGEVGVGLVFVFQTIPMLALLPIGGQMGDAGDRRRRLVALDLVRASLAGLVVVGTQGHLLGLVLVAAGASRGASALYDPGRRRLVTVVLPRDLIAAGGSLISAVAESSILVAPALGALLLLIGLKPTSLILLDGCTFLVSAALVSRVGPQPSVWSQRRASARQGWRSLQRGLAIIFLDRTVAVFTAQVSLAAVLSSVITVYFVPLARQSFGISTNQVGVMYVIVGAASVAGSLLAVRTPMVRRRGLIVVGYIDLLVVILVGSMLGAVVMVVALLVFAGAGALQESWGLNRIQATVPESQVGQAFGAVLWCTFLGRGVGAALGAWGATHLGQPAFFDLLAAGAVAVCLLAGLRGMVSRPRRTQNWPPGGPPLPLEP